MPRARRLTKVPAGVLDRSHVPAGAGETESSQTMTLFPLEMGYALLAGIVTTSPHNSPPSVGGLRNTLDKLSTCIEGINGLPQPGHHHHGVSGPWEGHSAVSLPVFQAWSPVC